MEIKYESGRNEVKGMTTAELRGNFLIQNLISKDQFKFVYSIYDRMILGGIQPGNHAIDLPNYPELKSLFFLERREIGIINIGGDAIVKADGQKYLMPRLSCLYLGMGTKEVSVVSNDTSRPSQLYMMSTPAHAIHPNTLYLKEQAIPAYIGSEETANKRTVYKYIHLNGIQSCQLVMGLTVLDRGNVWNTMPSHTHYRRSEAYFYFDMSDDQGVIHLMGEPQETRHLFVRNNEAIISPPWSIHSGAGIGAYSFIWAMAGENQDYTDMDFVPLNELL